MNDKQDLIIKNGVLTSYDGPGGDIAVPDGVTGIGPFSFYNRPGLKRIRIPDGAETIGMGAFEGCRGLTGITIPASVAEIKEHAFRDCPALTDVYYGGTREQWRRLRIGDGNLDLLIAAVHPGFDAAMAGSGADWPEIRVIDGVKYVRLDDLGALKNIAELHAGMPQA